MRAAKKEGREGGMVVRKEGRKEEGGTERREGRMA